MIDEFFIVSLFKKYISDYESGFKSVTLENRTVNNKINNHLIFTMFDDSTADIDITDYLRENEIQKYMEDKYIPTKDSETSTESAWSSNKVNSMLEEIKTKMSQKLNVFSMTENGADNTGSVACDTVFELGLQSGKPIYFSSGTYKLNKNYILPENIKIFGDSQFKSKIITTITNTDYVFWVNKINNYEIYNLHMTHVNGTRQNGGILLSNSDTTTSSNSYSSSIHDMRLENYTHGLKIDRRLWWIKVYNMWICNCIYGIYSSSADCYYHDLAISGCDYGMYLVESVANKYVNIKIDWCSSLCSDIRNGWGIYASSTNRDMFTNVEVQQCFGNGAKFYNCKNLMFSNFISDANGQAVTNASTKANYPNKFSTQLEFDTCKYSNGSIQMTNNNVYSLNGLIVKNSSNMNINYMTDGTKPVNKTEYFNPLSYNNVFGNDNFELVEKNLVNMITSIDTPTWSTSTYVTITQENDYWKISSTDTTLATSCAFYPVNLIQNHTYAIFIQYKCENNIVPICKVLGTSGETTSAIDLRIDLLDSTSKPVVYSTFLSPSTSKHNLQIGRGYKNYLPFDVYVYKVYLIDLTEFDGTNMSFLKNNLIKREQVFGSFIARNM